MNLARIATTLLAIAASGPAVATAGEACWRARVDALLLAPQISGRGFAKVFPPGEDNDLEGSLDGALQGGVRFVIGKENCTGLGVQFRYFNFDNDVGYQGDWNGAAPAAVAGDLYVDVHAVDVEATQRGSCGYWEFFVTGGLRQAGAAIGQTGALFAPVGVFYDQPSGVDFDGVGPTVSFNAERPLGGTALSLVGRARMALLFGETTQAYTFGVAAPPPPATHDDFVQVTEVQFGLNYEHCMRGATGSFGVFWEAQRWDSDTELLGNLGFHGLSLQTGVAY